MRSTSARLPARPMPTHVAAVVASVRDFLPRRFRRAGQAGGGPRPARPCDGSREGQYEAGRARGRRACITSTSGQIPKPSGVGAARRSRSRVITVITWRVPTSPVAPGSWLNGSARNRCSGVAARDGTPPRLAVFDGVDLLLADHRRPRPSRPRPPLRDRGPTSAAWVRCRSPPFACRANPQIPAGLVRRVAHGSSRAVTKRSCAACGLIAGEPPVAQVRADGIS
jgi:hypothetical protein